MTEKCWEVVAYLHILIRLHLHSEENHEEIYEDTWFSGWDSILVPLHYDTREDAKSNLFHQVKEHWEGAKIHS
jgi:hypothetical protein